MKALIDTNIVLDILLAREPFLESAMKIIQMVDNGKMQVYVTANSITDIIYISRKHRTLEELQRLILDLLDRVDVIGVDRDDIISAFKLGFNDFEDALQSACSEKAQMEYIITRNKKDFSCSNVTVIDLSEFLAMHC